jgi:P2 family phage contractile tail tube protein
MYPQRLTNFVAFADGKGYVGLVPELNLPKLTLKTEEYRGGGMDTPVAVVTGTEKLEASFTLAEYNADVLSLWGIAPGTDKQFVFRGAMQRQGEDAVPIVATLSGHITEHDPGSWKPGEQATLKATIALTYFKLTINNVDVIVIDVINMIRMVNGVDQLASQRTALGI